MLVKTSLRPNNSNNGGHTPLIPNTQSHTHPYTLTLTAALLLGAFLDTRVLVSMDLVGFVEA